MSLVRKREAARLRAAVGPPLAVESLLAQGVGRSRKNTQVPARPIPNRVMVTVVRVVLSTSSRPWNWKYCKTTPI